MIYLNNYTSIFPLTITKETCGVAAIDIWPGNGQEEI
jgi:hypothetical protein